MDRSSNIPDPVKVLLVEDMRFDRELFKNAFSNTGMVCHVTECEQAEEALQYLENGPTFYNIIVIDHTLPGMSGLDLSKKIIALRLNIPIILLTGTGSEEIASEAIRIGIKDYIIKGSDTYKKMLPLYIGRVLREDSARKAHEAARQELDYQRTLLEGIFRYTPDAMIISDRSDTILMNNPALSDMFGYQEGEVMGKKIDILYKVGERRGKGFISRGTDASIPYPVTYVRKNGESFLGETISSAIKNIDGKDIAFFGYIRDVSEREKAEDTKKRQVQINSVLHTILQTSLEPLSLSAVIDYSLKAILSIPGLSFLKKGAIFLADEEGQFFKLEAKYGLDDCDEFFCDLFNSGKCDCTWILPKKENTFVDRDPAFDGFKCREINLFEHYCVPIFSGNQVIGVIKTSIEAAQEKRPEEAWFLTMVANTLAGIIERKKAEDKLRFLGKAIETTHMGVTISDLDGKIIYVNPAEAEMHGYSVDEIIGQKTDIFAPSEIVKPLGVDQLPELSDRRRESINVRKDGSRFPVYLLSDVVNDERGNHVGFVTTCEDITKRKKAEEELKDSYEQIRNLAKHLETAREEERKRVARDIHDELGQMLTVISFDVAWFAGRIDKKNRAVHNKIKETLDHIDLLIEKVQAISSELRPTILDDLGLIAGMEWHARRFEKATNIECHVNILGEIPELDETLSVELFRTFQESLTNVARHSKASQVVADMDIVNNCLQLLIRDNGAGAEEEKIMAPSSVGIIGMRERIRPWGGKLEITGEKGKGTTVRIIIPFM